MKKVNRLFILVAAVFLASCENNNGSSEWSSQPSVPPVTYPVINVYENGQVVQTIKTNTNGDYVLPVPNDRDGHYYQGYFDSENNIVPLYGNITSNLDLTIEYNTVPFSVTNETSFDYAFTYGFNTVSVNESFELTESIFVTRNMTIKAGADATIKRASTFGGDCFVVGLDKDNNSVVATGSAVTLTIDANEHEFVFDGNKDVIYETETPTVEVKGSMFFVCELSKLILNGGVIVQNNQKTGNERAFLFGKETDRPYLSTPEKTGGAAVLNVEGTIVVNNAVVRKNVVNTSTASCNGGAIYNYGTLKINNGTFSENVADYGAVSYSSKKLEVKKGTFSDNISEHYGALYFADSQYSNGELLAENAGEILFKDNRSNSSGGAMFVAYKATVTIKNASFEGNSANSNGGAINSKGILHVDSTRFYQNTSGSKGGAVYAYDDDSVALEGAEPRQARFNNCQFIENSSKAGGALFFGQNNSSSYQIATDILYDASVSNSTFEGNTSSANGGAIYAYTANLVLDTITATNNVAQGSGLGGFLYMSYKTFDAEDPETHEIVTYKSAPTIVHMYDVTSTGNGASKGGFVYLTTTDTTLYIHSGSSTLCTGTGPNIYANTNKVVIYIKGTDTKSDFDYDGVLLAAKSTLPTIYDIEEE